MIKQVELTNRSGHVLRGIVDIPDEGSRFPAIVNVHGFTGNKSGYKNSYTQTARFLAKHGFASVRFDLFGNGESDGEFEDMTFTGILEDIEDIINWTKQQDFADPEKVILSGQSMGGYAAATAAPRVNPYALILMCPGAGMWFGCKERAEAMEAKGITSADIEGLCFATSFNHDLYQYEPFSSAAGYEGPVLIVRGTADDLVDDATCHKYETLYSEKCTYQTIEGANHNFASASARKELNESILTFLQALE